MKLFRNDDVNPNSSLADIVEMYEIIRRYFPDAEIFSCITLLAKTSENGSAYPEIKPRDINFPSVDKIFPINALPKLEKIASHGLFHLDHRAVSRDLQKHSILASCEILNTKIFVPPFLRYNRKTKNICDRANILLWGISDEWQNLDNDDLDPGGNLFLFHSWKFTPQQFEEKIKLIAK